MMNVADVILFILDPSGHCGYPMDVQTSLLEEVKGMVQVPVLVVANKSDIATADGYRTMSTQTGDGVEDLFTVILTHRPERTEEQRVIDIRAPIVHEEEAPEIDPMTGRVKRRRIRRPRKPRSEKDLP